MVAFIGGDSIDMAFSFDSVRAIGECLTGDLWESDVLLDQHMHQCLLVKV